MGSIQKRITKKTGKEVFIVRYRDKTGKEHSKSFKLRRDAAAYLAEQESSLHRGTWVDPSVAAMTVGQVYQEWLSRPLRDTSRKVYQYTLDSLMTPIRDIPIDSLTRADVDAWYQDMRTCRYWISKKDRGITPLTARSAVTHLASAMSYAVREEYISRSPVVIPRTDRTGAVQRKDLPSLEQMHDIIDLLDAGGFEYEAKKGVHQEYRPHHTIADMIQVAYMTGMRLGEICALQAGDIDLYRGVISVTAQLDYSGGLRERKTLKGGEASTRDIPIPAGARRWWKERIGGKSSQEYIFTSQTCRPYTPSSAGGALRPVLKELNLTKYSFHSFRHLFASKLIEAGRPIPEVSYLLGHVSISTTMKVYLHLLPGSEKESRKAISEILPEGFTD